MSIQRYRIGSTEVHRGTDEHGPVVRTIFDPGVTSFMTSPLLARPVYDDASKARAEALGYLFADDGTDLTPTESVDAMTLDHDVIHSLLAQARGQDVSPALYAAASGTGCTTGDDEERIVFLIQRLLNVGLDAVLEDHPL